MSPRQNRHLNASKGWRHENIDQESMMNCLKIAHSKISGCKERIYGRWSMAMRFKNKDLWLNLYKKMKVVKRQCLRRETLLRLMEKKTTGSHLHGSRQSFIGMPVSI